jgi:hypothetical protein
MPQRPPWPAATLASPLLLLALQGCASPMTSKATSSDQAYPDREEAISSRLVDGPLRIHGHNMGAYCFSTWGCRVVYGRHIIMDRPFDEWQPPSRTFDHLRERMEGTYGGLRAFEAPVVVEWLDSRREKHTHTIDLDVLFPERRLVYRVPDGDIRPDASVGPPDIVVEVDDRVVRVHMRAHLPLKVPRVPGNPLTDFADEIVTVYQKTL